jgi:hypothetical protein
VPAPISPAIADLFEQLGPLDLDNLPDLRGYLSWVPDPRSRRGRWYSLESLRLRGGGRGDHARGGVRVGAERAERDPGVPCGSALTRWDGGRSPLAGV